MTKWVIPRAGSGRRSKIVTPELAELLRELHARGLTAREAAAKAGCSQGTVSGFWWKNGLRRMREHLTPEEIAKLRQRDREYERDMDHAEYKRLKRAKVKRKEHTTGPVSWQARFMNPEDRRAGR